MKKKRERTVKPLTCIQQRRARSTGALIGVYHDPEANYDFPWITMCETHDSVTFHRLQTEATEHAAIPEAWCEECEDVQIHNSLTHKSRLAGIPK